MMGYQYSSPSIGHQGNMPNYRYVWLDFPGGSLLHYEDGYANKLVCCKLD